MGRRPHRWVYQATVVWLMAGPGSAFAQETSDKSASTPTLPSGPSSSGTQASATTAYPPCDHTPTEGDVAGAKGAFEAGTAAYNEADYERAITYWEDAFRHDCTATPLLLNLARAYEASMQFQNAIVALRTFNERNQDSPRVAQNERWIERLQEQLNAQAQAQAQPPPPTPTPKPEPAPEPVKPPPPKKEIPKPEAQHNDAALYVAIAGGGVAALSALLYLKERHDANGFADVCGKDRKSCPDDATTKEAEKARKGALFFGWTTGVGAVVGVTGLVWYLIDGGSNSDGAADSKHSAQGSIHVTPAVLPTFAGISVDGRFAF